MADISILFDHLPSSIFTNVVFRFSAFSERIGGRKKWHLHAVSLIRVVLANTSLPGSIVETLLTASGNVQCQRALKLSTALRF